jgi:acetyl esterase
MPLDPDAKAFLDLLASGGGPQIHDVPVTEARRLMEAMGALQGEGEAVREIADRAIPGPAGDIPARIYWPAATDVRPLLVYLHGGGWVLGSPATHDGVCRALTNATGCVVISVDYRLAPEHPFPAAAEDGYAAVRWAADHAASLGADARRLAVAGDSAGGNLAAVVSLMARDRGGPGLRMQILAYPVIDGRREYPSHAENAEGYLLTTDSMRWFWGHYVPHPADRADPYASPIAAPDLGGLPPALVFTAEYDPLRDEGEAYARALEAAGVPTTLRRYDGQIHGFFTMTNTGAASRRALGEVAAALAAAFA